MVLKFIKNGILIYFLVFSSITIASSEHNRFNNFIELTMQYSINQLDEEGYLKSAKNLKIANVDSIQAKVFYFMVFNHRRALAEKLGIKVAIHLTDQDWQELKKVDAVMYGAQKATFVQLHLSDDLTIVDALKDLKAELIALDNKQAIAQVAADLAQYYSLYKEDHLSGLIEYLYAVDSLPTYENSLAGFLYSKEFALQRIISSFYTMGAYETALDYVLQLYALSNKYFEVLDNSTPYYEMTFVLAHAKQFSKALNIADFYLQKVQKERLEQSSQLYAVIAKSAVLIKRQQEGDLKTAQSLLRNSETDLNSDNYAVKARSLVVKTLLDTINGKLSEAEKSVDILQKFIQSNRSIFSQSDFRDVNELQKLVYEFLGKPELANKAMMDKFEFEKDFMLSAFNNSLNNVGNYLQRDIEILALKGYKAETEKQALKIETQNLRFLLMALIITMLIFLISWLIWRQFSIKKIAETDSLTGVMNRRAMYSWLEKRKPRNSFKCICLLDLDHFKQINDNYGHLTGDEVLTSFSHFVQTRIRKTDKLSRFGGEEFLLVLDSIDKEKAQILIDNIRESFQNYINWHTTTSNFSTSFSAGIIETSGDFELQQVLAQCDVLLYKAKENGRARSESACFEAKIV